jgi:cell division septation protein DedD
LLKCHYIQLFLADRRRRRRRFERYIVPSMTDPSPGLRSKDDKEQAPGGSSDGDSNSDVVVGNNKEDKDALSASSYSDDYTSSYDDSDDSDFSETSETSGAADDTAAAEAEMMREEAKQLCFWRSIVLGSMFVATIILIIVVYNFTRRGEYKDFEQEFEDYAAKIMETVPQKLAQAIGQVDVLAMSVMSYANQVNVEWPYAAIPEFELKARNTRRLGGLEFVSLVPVVPTAERETWESFAVTEKDWVEWGYFQQEQGDEPPGSGSGGINRTTAPPATVTPGPESSTTETATPSTGTPQTAAPTTGTPKTSAPTTGTPETTDPPTAAPVTAPDNTFVPFRNRVLLERKAKEEDETTTTTNSSDHATAEAMQVKFASMEEALEDFWNTYGTTTGTIVNFTSSTTNSDAAIATQIYRMDGIHKIVEDHPGPFFPMWQSSPVVPSVVNFNLASHATAGPEVLLALDSAQIVLGAVVNTTAQDDPFQVMDVMENMTVEERIAAGPISFLYFPVTQTVPLTTTTTTGAAGQSETQVVALLTSMIRWTDVLQGDDLPDTARDILCVVENDCDQRYSFLVSKQQVIYLGQEHVLDATFRHLFLTTSFQTLFEEYLEHQEDGEGTLTSTPNSTLNANYCPYRLSIYPTAELQKQFITNKPELIAVLVGAAFCITAFVFLCYDGHVEKRQRLLVSKAVTSHQIVSRYVYHFRLVYWFVLFVLLLFRCSQSFVSDLFHNIHQNRTVCSLK